MTLARAARQVGTILLFALLPAILVFVFGLNTLSIVLASHWQFLDLPLLLEEPLQSLLTQHSQPPLLNVLVWLLGQFPGDLYTHFILLNALATGITAWVVLQLATAYSESRGIGVLLAIGFAVAPATLLFISYPLYATLSATGYALLVYGAFQLCRGNARAGLWLAAAALVYLSLLRSSVSFAHVVLIGAGLAFLATRRLPKREIAGVMLATLLLASAVPLKNLAMYGFFGSSSWGTLNLAKGLGVALPLGYFPEPKAIANAYPNLKCSASHGPQDAALVKTNGRPNYNACLLLEYARMVGPTIAKNYQPLAHARNIAYHLLQYLSPPEGYSVLGNQAKLAGYAALYQVPFMTVPLSETHAPRLLLPLLVVFTLVLAVRQHDTFLLFCLALMALQAATPILTDGVEGRRFVYDIEFLFYIMLGLLIPTLKNRAGKWRQHLQNAGANRGRDSAIRRFGDRVQAD